MDNQEISSIIHAAHEKIAPRYGDLDIHGTVPENTLAHWNYLRNVQGPLTRIVERYGPPRPFTMLDAGCGNGQLFHLYTGLGARAIFGADFSRNMLAIARERARVNAMEFMPVRTNLENLSAFPADHFPLVNLYGIIEHLPDPLRVLKELERVLAPGGIFIVSVPRKGSLAWLTYGLFCGSIQNMVEEESLMERVLRRRKMRLYRFFSARETVDLLAQLTHLQILDRVPIAHAGIVGPLQKPLKALAAKGRYGTLDRLNAFARTLHLVPAGEFIVLRKG